MSDNIAIPSVSAASIIGMAASLALSVGLPVALCIIVRKKTRARVSSFFIGAATFIVFAIVLESILHRLVQKAVPTLPENIWLYALYGGLAAGIFEETGRYLAMKLCMKKGLDGQNAVMYGVGHGGIEAILLAGVACVSHLVIAAMINGGQASALLAISRADETAYQAALAQMLTISATPPWQFYMVGLERVSAILFHISASYLVFLAVKERKPPFYLLAVLLHFLLDALAVITSTFLPIWAVELVLLLFSATVGLVVWKRLGRRT